MYVLGCTEYDRVFSSIEVRMLAGPIKSTKGLTISARLPSEVWTPIGAFIVSDKIAEFLRKKITKEFSEMGEVGAAYVMATVEHVIRRTTSNAVYLVYTNNW